MEDGVRVPLRTEKKRDVVRNKPQAQRTLTTGVECPIVTVSHVFGRQKDVGKIGLHEIDHTRAGCPRGPSVEKDIHIGATIRRNRRSLAD